MDSQWLKVQFDQNPDKTKAGLAKALGLEPPAISKILKGSRQIKAQEYAAMRRYFSLPVDGEGSLRPRRNSYVLEPLGSDGQLHDNAGGSDNDNNNSGDNEWVIPAAILSQRTQAASDQIKIFQVAENTMEPDFHRGERVLVDLSDHKPSPPGVFVVSDGFGCMLRQCEFLPRSEPPEVKISARDKSFQPQILRDGEFKIIGRVIAKLQWL